MTWIDHQFPDAVGKYAIKSPCDGRYNCIAYAADDTGAWVSHEVGYRWPAQRSGDIAALVAVFQGLGYEVCTSAELEAGLEKVALYELHGEWTHAARQLASGMWASKLGPDEDIEHDDPKCLCGIFYGAVHCVMRRPKA